MPRLSTGFKSVKVTPPQEALPLPEDYNEDYVLWDNEEEQELAPEPGPEDDDDEEFEGLAPDVDDKAYTSTRKLHVFLQAQRRGKAAKAKALPRDWPNSSWAARERRLNQAPWRKAVTACPVCAACADEELTDWNDYVKERDGDATAAKSSTTTTPSTPSTPPLASRPQMRLGSRRFEVYRLAVPEQVPIDSPTVDPEQLAIEDIQYSPI